jgi:uncharacterized protein (TIRG00374 family)
MDTVSRPIAAWIRRALLLLLLAAVVYFLLPRVGGLRQETVSLRHANWWLIGLAVALEGVSLLAYILLYRHILHAMGSAVPTLAVAEVVMATFLVSHVVPGGSAAGTAVNVDTMRARGVPASTSGTAVLLTTLISDVVLGVIFVIGLAYSVTKRSVPVAYVAVAVTFVPVLAGAVVLCVAAASRPALAESVGRWLGARAHVIRRSVDPELVGDAARRLSEKARKVLTPQALRTELLLAAANWGADIFVLYLFFLAIGFHQHLGAVVVAYSIGNLISVIPITPSGLLVEEAALVALSIPFGAPRQVAVLAVIGYRLVNFWLPLPFGAAAYVHLRAVVGGRFRRIGAG